LLDKRGHEVFLAADAIEVIHAVHGASPQNIDVVLIDTEMAGMNGLEAARTIRESERGTGRHLPIIGMTPNPSPKEEETCAAAGMDACLLTPVRPRALFETLARLANPMKHAESPKPVFDESVFLARLEGDELLAREIIEMFLEECPKLLENVRQAAGQHDASALARAAHTLKGSVGDVSAPQAFDAARTLEEMARKEEWEGTDRTLKTLESAVDELVHELRTPESKGEGVDEPHVVPPE
jgi:CheY-like chemotaxis protein/HPt (histidine-containing phosphotransfer) domain-containing protein